MQRLEQSGLGDGTTVLQTQTGSPGVGGTGFEPMMYEWTDAYEWQSLRIAVDNGYERNAFYRTGLLHSTYPNPYARCWKPVLLALHILD